jgi:hypothetical protein
MIATCERGDRQNDALVALAWIGDEAVQTAFSKWRDSPPAWVDKLFVPPHRYAEEAGWELTLEGKRRDLFHSVAFPLISPKQASEVNDAVKVGVPAEETCGWCKRKLVGLLEFKAIEDVFPDQGAGRVRIVTCHACTCFAPSFV